MLNEGVAELVGGKDAAGAWRQLFSSSDVVGIKSNEWPRLPTPAALEEAMRFELERVGVAPEDIAVADRKVKSNPVFQRATAFINTRPLRTHDWSGLGTCIKNLITFTERYPDYHGDACAPLGSIWLRPEIKGKVRLNVLVMLTPQFHSTGPHSFSKEFIWPYGGLILGVDPVAVDATGARIIEAKRKIHFGDDRCRDAVRNRRSRSGPHRDRPARLDGGFTHLAIHPPLRADGYTGSTTRLILDSRY
jgi:hypothetical protein